MTFSAYKTVKMRCSDVTKMDPVLCQVTMYSLSSSKQKHALQKVNKAMSIPLPKTNSQRPWKPKSTRKWKLQAIHF